MEFLLVPLFLHRGDRAPMPRIGGLLASRHRVPHEPDRHLRLLHRAAIVGIAIGWGGGVVQAPAHVGAFMAPVSAALRTRHVRDAAAEADVPGTDLQGN